MVYATPAAFHGRYTTKLTDAELSSHFLPYAGGRLNQLLAPYFSVPFSANNVTARDLTIDLAYLLLLQRNKEAREAEPLMRQVLSTIGALAGGQQAMVTDSGDVLYGQRRDGEVWSSTEQGQPVFKLNLNDPDWGLFCLEEMP